jgi:LPS-assembly protein
VLIFLASIQLEPSLAAQVDFDSRRPVEESLGAGPLFNVASPAEASPAPAFIRVPRIVNLNPNDLIVRGVTQTREGDWFRLRGSAEVETVDSLIRADEIDYNEATGQVLARGNVKFESFGRGEQLEAARVEYNMKNETGRFYDVRGSAPAKLEQRPGILTTTNPFIFQGDWAERLGNKYILYDGFVTDCRLPRPWWILKAPKFDIIPGDRAIAYKAQFKVRRVPVLYVPAFYKALAENPRKSGFLSPNIGTSSRRGTMLGAGYYWVINRSYDATYRAQWFSQRGFAHHADIRGKPTQNSDFNFIFYGVDDKGLKLEDGSRVKQGGYLITFDGMVDNLPKGFYGRADVNYLSSFTFRQAFTESFNEAVFSEVHSTGFVRKEWSTYSLGFIAERSDNYQSFDDVNRISIGKLPSAEFRSRDQEIKREVPIWFSFESSAGLLRRNQPLYQTRKFVDRMDIAPRIMTALRWKDFHLLPYASVRETHYGSSFVDGQVTGNGIWRHMQEAGAELVLPPLSRVYDGPKWLGEKVKHVIEPRGGIRWATGIDNFDRIIRFDDLDIYSNTKEVEYSLTQRWYAKKNKQTWEVVSWQLWQKRYFDPTFGGALTTGTLPSGQPAGSGRNVLWTQTDMTAFAFLDHPRRASPVASLFRVNPIPALGAEWRTDYDYSRRRFTNSSLVGSYRGKGYLVSLGHNHVRSISQLSPSANQFIGLAGVGRQDLRGWSAGFSAVYDFRIGAMQFATTQVSYNSDCCGLSMQYRRFNFGTRNENQFRVAFAVANIGSFGTLKRQERIF